MKGKDLTPWVESLEGGGPEAIHIYCTYVFVDALPDLDFL